MHKVVVEFWVDAETANEAGDIVREKLDEAHRGMHDILPPWFIRGTEEAS